MVGALIVLALVMVSAITIIRVGSQAAEYAQSVSSESLARDVQMASPPEMSVVLRNSSLYLLVSTATPINVSYAVVEEAGQVYVERVDRLVSGQYLLRVLENYSCQNVSIILVTSDGAIFRYVPSEDPDLMGRVPPGIDYFSCSFLRQGGLSGAWQYQQLLVGPQWAASINGTYLVGVGGVARPADLGTVNMTLRASGWVCGSMNFTLYVRGHEESAVVTSGGGLALSPLGWLMVGRDNVTILAFTDCRSYAAGLVILPASGYVVFSANASAEGRLYTPFTSSPGLLSAVALGFSGNFTSSGTVWQAGVTPTGGTNPYFYYTYGYASEALGRGVTQGPVELIDVLSPDAVANGSISLEVALNVTVVGAPEPANATFSLQAPVSYACLRPVLEGGGWPLLVAVLARSLWYVSPGNITFQTQEGSAVRDAGRGQFLIPFTSANVTLWAPQTVIDNVTTGYYTTKGGWKAFAVASPPVALPLPYLVEINSTLSGERIIFVSPVVGDRGLQVGSAFEAGPLLLIPVGVNVSGCASPSLASLYLSGGLAYVVGDWASLDEGLPPGAYVMACGEEGYLAIIS